MTDESAFIRSILAEPDADGPRLVYADWLEERGETARSEFIRVQIGERIRPCRACAIGASIRRPSQDRA